MNKVGKTFEELNDQDMMSIHGGAGSSSSNPTITTTFGSGVPWLVSASASLLVTAGVSYFVTK